MNVTQCSGDGVQSCGPSTRCLEPKVHSIIFSFVFVINTIIINVTLTPLWSPFLRRSRSNSLFPSQVFIFRTGGPMMGCAQLYAFYIRIASWRVPWICFQIYRHDLDILKTRQRIHQTNSESWFCVVQNWIEFTSSMSIGCNVELEIGLCSQKLEWVHIFFVYWLQLEISQFVGQWSVLGKRWFLSWG